MSEEPEPPYAAVAYAAMLMLHDLLQEIRLHDPKLAAKVAARFEETVATPFVQEMPSALKLIEIARRELVGRGK